MSRRVKLLRNVGIGLFALVTVAVIAGILIVRTDRFRAYVREKIVSATEEGTGGRVTIGSFAFDWTRLSAVVTDFVIHGNEPAGAAPYLSAHRAELHFRLFTSFKRLLDITYLGVERPQANILVAPDGSTNVPKPKQPSASKTNPLQTVVDLAVGRFALIDGSIAFNSRKQDFDLRGKNLRVQLWFNPLKQAYAGQIAMAPLYVVSGRNTPVTFQLTIPLTIGSNSIAVENGRLTTNRSQLTIDGSLENLTDPRASAHIRGSLALADLKNAANVPVALNARGLPSTVALDVNASAGDNAIDVAPSRIAFGASTIEASGKLQDPAGNGILQFQSHLAVGELGRLAGLDARPDGTIQLNGAARLNAQREYDVQANVIAKGLSFQQGARKFQNVGFTSAAHLTPHRLDLNGFQVDALGAQIAGNASLEDFARYTVNANLRRLDLQTLTRNLGQQTLAYDATVSGPIAAAGDLRAPGTVSLSANSRLTIRPGRQGIPLSGRLFVDYRGDTDNLRVADSYLVLPHSRLTLDGSLGNRLNVTVAVRDLRDFSPLLGSAPPVVLLGSGATFSGVVTGRTKSPQITGHLAVDKFSAQGRRFDGLSGDVTASASRAAVSAGNVRRGAMQAQFNAAVGLHNWEATRSQPLSVQASIRNGDLSDVMALAGTSPAGYSGALSAQIDVSGTLGNPRGAATLSVDKGTLHGEPIDGLQALVDLADRLVTVRNAHVTAGQSRLQLSAEFHHPPDRFDRGQLHARIESTQLDLSRLRTVQEFRPQTGGLLQANADITGELRDAKNTGDTEFLLTGVTADASGKSLQFDGQNYGDFSGAARTNRQSVSYNIDSNFAGSRIHVKGDTELAPDHRTTADASVSGLPIERILSLLKKTDVPAKGNLAATVHFTGTLLRPEGTLDATVDRGVFYDEPIDRVHARVNYAANSIDVPQLEIRAGSSTLDASARYDHPAGVLNAGNLQFRVNNARVDLSRLRNVQKQRPGLAGTVQITANGAAAVRNLEPRILARDVNLTFAAKGIALPGRSFGDLTLTAGTAGGRTTFALDSNLAGASLQGKGSAQLAGDYPLDAQLIFRNVTWKGLQPLLGSAAPDSQDVDAATDGQLTLHGPALHPDAMSGRLQLSRVQVTAATPGPRNQPLTVENQGPIVVALDRGVARIESLHLAGPETDVQVRGAASLTAQTLEANVSAHTDLSLLRRFRRDVVSSGQLIADGTVRGTFAKPLINGKIQLRDASLNLADAPTGLSNANGIVEFTGATASFRNITGQAGGGKVTLSGFLNYSDALRLALRVNANKVRLRLQPGVSAIADADLRLSGRTDASVLSGSIAIDSVSYAPESDFGAILSRAAPPVQAPSTPSPLLDNMKLDVQVRTSSATAVHASLAQNLQADANLRLQGTANQPGVLGRITIDEGRLVFFNSTYSVNSGTISFFNPVRIEPVLDLSLATQAKGVEITLRVTGPIDNMKLSYTSEPPIRFQEIVGLLAAGQAPTSDPTLLANQPAQPTQGFEQMGESALLSKALADPVSSRLKRVFGVTQFKIDPTFVSGSDLPQAQLTLQQQVTSHLTLTYSTALDNPNAQAIHGEYTLSPQWSATATRDQYGMFSVKFLYKKQFR